MNTIKPTLDIKNYLNNSGSLIELLEDNEFSQEEKNLALYEACNLGKIKIVDALMDSGAEIDESQNGQNGFLAACENGHLSVVMFLSNRNVDIHTQEDKALINASSKGHWDMVDFLLDSGATVHAQNGAALVEAAIHNHGTVTQLLLENGANPDAKDSMALRFASDKGFKDVVQILLEYDANPAAQGNQAILWAHNKGHHDVVSLLHSYGADLNKARPKKYTSNNFKQSMDILKESQSLKLNAMTDVSKNILMQSLSPSALAELPLNPVKTDFKFENFLTMVCSVNILPPDEPDVTNEPKKPKI